MGIEDVTQHKTLQEVNKYKQWKTNLAQNLQNAKNKKRAERGLQRLEANPDTNWAEMRYVNPPEVKKTQFWHGPDYYVSDDLYTTYLSPRFESPSGKPLRKGNDDDKATVHVVPHYQRWREVGWTWHQVRGDNIETIAPDFFAPNIKALDEAYPKVQADISNRMSSMRDVIAENGINSYTPNSLQGINDGLRKRQGFNKSIDDSLEYLANQKTPHPFMQKQIQTLSNRLKRIKDKLNLENSIGRARFVSSKYETPQGERIVSGFMSRAGQWFGSPEDVAVEQESKINKTRLEDFASRKKLYRENLFNEYKSIVNSSEYQDVLERKPYTKKTYNEVLNRRDESKSFDFIPEEAIKKYKHWDEKFKSPERRNLFLGNLRRQMIAAMREKARSTILSNAPTGVETDDFFAYILNSGSALKADWRAYRLNKQFGTKK